MPNYKLRAQRFRVSVILYSNGPLCIQSKLSFQVPSSLSAFTPTLHSRYSCHGTSHISLLLPCLMFGPACSFWGAVLGLHRCAGFSLVAESKGYSPAAARGLLILAASLVVRTGSGALGLEQLGSVVALLDSRARIKAVMPCSMWDLP